jgi:hypothetical protein
MICLIQIIYDRHASIIIKTRITDVAKAVAIRIALIDIGALLPSTRQFWLVDNLPV